jgi:hypothetical protein
LDQRSREEEYEKEIENMSKSMQNRKLQIEQIEEVTIFLVKSTYFRIKKRRSINVCLKFLAAKFGS